MAYSTQADARIIMLPPEAIQQFKQLYLKEEGIELSDTEAEQKANALIELFMDLTSTPKVVNNETSTI